MRESLCVLRIGDLHSVFQYDRKKGVQGLVSDLSCRTPIWFRELSINCESTITQIISLEEKHSSNPTTEQELREHLHSYKEQMERLDVEIEQGKEDNPHSLELVVTARNQVQKQILEIEAELERLNAQSMKALSTV
jgi:hypothetical protein